VPAENSQSLDRLESQSGLPGIFIDLELTKRRARISLENDAQLQTVRVRKSDLEKVHQVTVKPRRCLSTWKETLQKGGESVFKAPLIDSQDEVKDCIGRTSESTLLESPAFHFVTAPLPVG
jgi:hypothetical protein